MNRRRRLVGALIAAAAILLAGRALAVLYSEYAWYQALGAFDVWGERVRDVTVIQVVSATFAGLFALLNLSAIRRSIISLAFPRRLGNVEFGEAVPRRHLDRGAFLLAALVAGAMAFAVPKWSDLALVRTGVSFGERDPFFQMDLSFHTAWLPLERAVYAWVLILLVLVSAIVIGLYALTPSLRWSRGAFHVSVRVRRHLAVLASLFMLVLAWSHRLDGYALLVRGSGAEGAFSYADHQWLLPAYLSLSVGTVAAAVLVLVTGWTGQVRTAFVTVTAVLLFSLAVDFALPTVARRFAWTDSTALQERPYLATREAFTRRAYGFSPGPPVGVPREVSRFSGFADSARAARILGVARDSALVYPGAEGAALVRNGPRVAAPALGDGLQRLAHAWSEQRLDLAWSSLAADTKIARRRDVRERLNALMPVFTQGSNVVPAYLGDTLVWVVELYSASSDYPLSRHYQLAGRRVSYFRHSGTSLTNARTGRVVIVPVAAPDPIAAAWRARFPSLIRRGGADLLEELRAIPRAPVAAVTGAAPRTDSAFRAEVARLYNQMRNALSAEDLRAFGATFDSLGSVVER